MPSAFLVSLLLTAPLSATPQASQVPAQVQGLLPGESWESLSAVAAPGANPWMEWDGIRLIDAVSGAPIVGARFDAHIEDYYSVDEEVTPVATALTGEDGSAYVARPAGLPGKAKWEKFVVQAEGYQNYGEALCYGYGEMALWKAQPLEVEFRDFAGEPIEGAVIRSRHTCSHEVPSFVGRSDAAGRMDLSRYPLAFDDAEARVFAPGYFAFGGEYPAALAWQVAAHGKAVIYLPKSPSVQVRYLSEDGEPVAGARLLLNSEPWRVARTDAEGLASFTSLADCRGYAPVTSLAARGMEASSRFGVGGLPAGRVTTVRAGQVHLATTIQPLGKFSLLPNYPPGPAHSSSTRLFHADGYYCRSDLDYPEQLPTGEYTLMVGGPFKLYQEQAYSFRLTSAGSKLTINPRLAPVLRLFTGGDNPLWNTLWIQAGEHSMYLAGDSKDYHKQSIPAGTDVTLLWYSQPGGSTYDEQLVASVRRLHLGVIDEDLTVDREMFKEAELMRAPIDRAAWPKQELMVSAREWPVGTQDLPLTWASVRVGSDLLDSTLPAAASPTKRAYEVPRGVPARVMLKADGYESLGMQRTLQEGERKDAVFHLRAMASLRVGGRAALALVGGEVVTAGELESGIQLRPGRHRLTLIDGQGERVEMDLEMAPGAARSISW